MLLDERAHVRSRERRWVKQITDGSSAKVVTVHPGSVHKFYHKQVKMLSEDIQTKVLSQLSLTTLNCIFKEKFLAQDPAIVAAGYVQHDPIDRNDQY